MRVVDGSLILPVQLNITIIVTAYIIGPWRKKWVTSLNSVALGLPAVSMMHCYPWLESHGFCPLLVQFNVVQLKWLQSFAPPTSPSGGWSRIPSLFGMSIVLAIAVSSHNLVPRAGTIGIQCEYYTTGTVSEVTSLISVVFGLRPGGMMNCYPWLELLGFCPPFGQFHGVQWKLLQVSPLPPPLVVVDLAFPRYSVCLLSWQSRFPPII